MPSIDYMPYPPIPPPPTVIPYPINALMRTSKALGRGEDVIGRRVAIDPTREMCLHSKSNPITFVS